MVYDGYTEKNGGLSVVTVVGYGIIQVDTIGAPTWTGHAIPHGISGQADAYITSTEFSKPKLQRPYAIACAGPAEFPFGEAGGFK